MVSWPPVPAGLETAYHRVVPIQIYTGNLTDIPIDGYFGSFVCYLNGHRFRLFGLANHLDPSRPDQACWDRSEVNTAYIVKQAMQFGGWVWMDSPMDPFSRKIRLADFESALTVLGINVY